jgi:phytoene synthase
MSIDVRRAYDICDSVMRSAAGNFSYGIRLLPHEKRRALSAVYAFARRIDDIGDGSLAKSEKLARLDEARDALKNLRGDDRDPVRIALADAAERLNLPLDAFGDLIDGVTMDVRGEQFETFPELVRYCRCVAGSIGRLSLGVFGTHDEDISPGSACSAQLADDLGVALQLTNILRDLREDLIAGRIYLPQEELRAAGIELGLDALGFVADPDGRLAQLIRMEAMRAEQWYAEGLQLLPRLDRRSAACCAALAGVYHRLLQRIAASPTRVLRHRTSLPSSEKTLIAVRSLAGVVT